MSPGNLIVRANYLATVVFGSILALIIGTGMVSEALTAVSKNWPTIVSVLLLTTLLIALPAARAFRRWFASGNVVPPELVNERPVVAWVVSLAGGVGHFFLVISFSAVFEILLEPERGEDVGGPIAFAIILTLLSYVIALLCGELVLVGDGKSDSARASSRVPI